MVSSMRTTFLCADRSCVTGPPAPFARESEPIPRGRMPRPPMRPPIIPGRPPPPPRPCWPGPPTPALALYSTRRGPGPPRSGAFGIGTPGLPSQTSMPVFGAGRGGGGATGADAADDTVAPADVPAEARADAATGELVAARAARGE